MVFARQVHGAHDGAGSGAEARAGRHRGGRRRRRGRRPGDRGAGRDAGDHGGRLRAARRWSIRSPASSPPCTPAGAARPPGWSAPALAPWRERGRGPSGSGPIVGPAVAPERYQVTDEVAARALAGRSAACRWTPGVARPDGPGHWLVDLVAANRQQLRRGGVPRRSHRRVRRVHHGRALLQRPGRPSLRPVRPAGAVRRLSPVRPARTATACAVAWEGPAAAWLLLIRHASPRPIPLRRRRRRPGVGCRHVPLLHLRPTPSPSASRSGRGATGTTRRSGRPCASCSSWPACRTTRPGGAGRSTSATLPTHGGRACLPRPLLRRRPRRVRLPQRPRPPRPAGGRARRRTGQAGPRPTSPRRGGRSSPSAAGSTPSSRWRRWPPTTRTRRCSWCTHRGPLRRDRGRGCGDRAAGRPRRPRARPLGAALGRAGLPQRARAGHRRHHGRGPRGRRRWKAATRWCSPTSGRRRCRR